jgi:hypothetical protein
VAGPGGPAGNGLATRAGPGELALTGLDREAFGLAARQARLR